MVAILNQHPAMVPDSDAVRSFCVDLVNDGQIHLVSIAPDSGSISGTDFGCDVDRACKWALEQNEAGKGVYWTVNSVVSGINKKPKKGAISACRYAHADIDPPKDGAEFDRAAALVSLVQSACPPSFIIDSGNGLQAFWRLDEPCENTSHIEEINRGIQHAFNADACFNIDRLMRVPGLINWPNKKKLAAGRTPALSSIEIADDGVVYKPEELAAAFPQAEQRAPDLLNNVKVENRVQLPSDLARFTPDDLGLPYGLSLRDDIEGPIAAKWEGDASRWGQSVAGQMARDGYNDQQIAGILLNPENGCSEHYLKQSDPFRGADRSIAAARRKYPAPIEPLDSNDLGGQKVIAKPCVPKGEPGWMRDLQGPIRDYVQHTIDQSHREQPMLALAGALPVFGTLAGRRYQSESGLLTNLYTVGIAGSGSGKEMGLGMAQALFDEAQLASMLGGEEVASGRSIITTLLDRPTCFLPFDEFGKKLGQLTSAKSGMHEADIFKVLMTMFSASQRTYRGVLYASQDRKQGGRPLEPIPNPCLSFYGVTTGSTFWKALSSGEALDGSLARMIIFECDDSYPTQRRVVKSAMPPHLVESAQAIANGADDHCWQSVLGDLGIPNPYVVRMDENAVREDDNLMALQDDLLRAHQGGREESFYARMRELSIKIAMIRAISIKPGAPIISKEDMIWAIELVQSRIEHIAKSMNRNLADNESEALLKKTLEIIRSGGKSGLTGTELSIKTQFLPRRGRDRTEIIDELVNAGQIRVDDSGLGNSRGRRYVAID
ncbi:DUF3987 domain-containing protein [uncultured Parasphingorhabdus sp.]|uniref:DUF3987 domain-containing protein n=1 Tax=uncultured Parasphingorhabdus sp. TaxID=2709694 RepID=UPI002AA5F302|nr:DUF3987 domain-containing protein [uncultured Parasphingorhabdus sp.]